MKRILFFAICLITLLTLYGSDARAMDECLGRRFPHGNYCEGRGRGWYGERKAVGSQAEAQRLISEYFSSTRGVKVGNIKERKWFFEAEIRDQNDKLIDVVIVDKRSGRIRSIY